VHPFNKSKNPIYFLRLPTEAVIPRGTEQGCEQEATRTNEIQLLIDAKSYSSKVGQKLTFEGMLLPPGTPIDVKKAVLAGANEIN
jgi:hypothetical protein